MSHTYDSDGREKKSVTTILSDVNNKSALGLWMVNEAALYLQNFIGIKLSEKIIEMAKIRHRILSKKALAVGSEVHDYLDRYIKDGIWPEKDCKYKESEKCLNAATQWMLDYDFKPVSSEVVVSSEHSAGTMDLKGWMNPKGLDEPVKYVLDWKSSKKVYREHGVQVAAYRHMDDDDEVEGIGVIRLDKETGKYQFKDFTKKYDELLREWFSSERLYYDRHPILAKKAGWNDK